MHDAEIETLEHRVAQEPRDVDAWIRLVTWVWRASGWEAARRVMHRGWARVRGDPGSEDRFRELLLTGFQMVGDPSMDRSSFVRSLSVSADGAAVLTSAADEAGHLFDLASGRMRARLPGFAAAAPLVDLSRDGRQALVVTGGGNALLYALPSSPARSSGVARRTWSGNRYRTAEGWVSASRFGIQRPPDPHARYPLAGALSPAGDALFLADARHRPDLPVRGLAHRVEAFRITPGGEVEADQAYVRDLHLGLGFPAATPRLLAGLGGRALRLVEPGTARTRGELPLPWGAPTHPERALLAGSTLLLLGASGDGHVLELEAPRAGPPRLRRRARLDLPTPRLRALAMSRDGSRLALGLEGPRALEVRGVDDGALHFHTEELEEQVRAVAFLPDGGRLAVAQRRHVRLVDL